MPGDFHIEYIFKKYRVDSLHARHVAEVATCLFKLLSETMKLAPGFSRYLHLAALLHDIGKSISADANSQVGARIILEEQGLYPLSDEFRSLISLTILFHGQKSCPVENLEKIACELPVSPPRNIIEQALKFSSILCLADALDETRSQVARIKKASLKSGVLRLVLSSTTPDSTINAAVKNGELLSRVTGLKLEISRAQETSSPPYMFSGVLEPFRTSFENLSRLASYLLSNILEHYEKISSSPSDDVNSIEALHDMRVTLRRARLSFKLIARLIKNIIRDATDSGWPGILSIPQVSVGALHEINEIEISLADLGRAAGSSRDLDVFIEFLESEETRHQFEKKGGYRRLLRSTKTLRKNVRKEVLTGSEIRNTTLLIAGARRFLETTMSEFVYYTEEKWKFLNSRYFFLERLKRSIEKAAHFREEHLLLEPAELHSLRSIVRRARYIAEFAAPIAGPKLHELALSLKKISDGAGETHDMDVALELIQKLPSLDGLAGYIKMKRAEAEQRFELAWKTLFNPYALNKLIRLLKKESKGEFTG